MVIQVSQEVYDMIKAQRDSFENGQLQAAQYVTDYTAMKASHIVKRDELNNILDELEIV